MKLKYYLRGLGIGIAVTALIMSVVISKTKTVSMTDEEIIARAESLGMVMEDKLLVNPSETAVDADNNSSAKTDSQETDQNIIMEPASVEEDTIDAETENQQDKAEADSDEKAKEEAIKKAEEEVKKKAEEEAKKAEEEAKKKAEEEAKKKAEEEAKKKADEEAKKKADEEAKKKAEEEAKKKAEEEAKKKADEEAKKKSEAAPVSIPVEGTVVQINVTAGSGSERVSEQLYQAGLVKSATEFNAYLCSGGYDRRLTTGVHNVIAGSSYAEIARVMTTSTKK